MIIKDLIRRVQTGLQDFTDEVKEDILGWIFDCKEDMLRLHDFESFKQKYTFTADGSTEYVLPADFGSMIKCVANGLIVPNYMSNVAANLRFRLIQGYTIGEIVSVQSDNTNDTAVVVSIYADPLTGEVLTLTGTTPVLSSGSFATIRFLYKDLTIGKVTLKRQSGSTILVLPKNKLNYNIRSIQFSAAINNGDVDIWYLPIIERLMDDYATDQLQVNYSRLIIDYCLYRGFGDQDNAALESKHYGYYNDGLIKAIREDRKNRRRNLSATINPVRY